MSIFRIDVFDSNPVVMTEQLVIEHVDFLTELHKQGTLIFCGPCFEDGAAMLLVHADSKQDADNLIAQDPFSTKQFYRQRTIKEIAICNIENQFLLQGSLEFIRANQTS
ncbi:YciI family protein [Vibrio cyclitrophicus]|uniref:YciI family protein n=1 Tax=Vibrio cyclitrophicus TaxID=47951 RepID=UPI00037E0DEB|nr:YciI family protein [Vibrio cyclitrophicus]OEF24931.1 hypothetical protein OA9_16885 [Vibrio cyclitrophicus 1F97]OEF33289.1 hypothetical protein OA7_14500 [Vibrio cyclitrophicus 1F53]OEF43376.1 hypothetical protein OAC_09870 [Vibrio cyclitrophicus 1F273]OEF66697.1 hypothetical protein OAA_08105 [Vibrio cyclitrophicus 1F175]PMH36269.1 hypothetical protein BCU72_08920 [Vibrio cyclitrophicus]